LPVFRLLRTKTSGFLFQSFYSNAADISCGANPYRTDILTLNYEEITHISDFLIATAYSRHNLIAFIIHLDSYIKYGALLLEH
jgi:hypothetical protein